MDRLVEGLQAGTDWDLMGQTDAVRAWLGEVIDERMDRADQARYQARVNLQRQEDVASYAGFTPQQRSRSEQQPGKRSRAQPYQRGPQPRSIHPPTPALPERDRRDLF